MVYGLILKLKTCVEETHKLQYTVLIQVSANIPIFLLIFSIFPWTDYVSTVPESCFCLRNTESADVWGSRLLYQLNTLFSPALNSDQINTDV